MNSNEKEEKKNKKIAKNLVGYKMLTLLTNFYFTIVIIISVVFGRVSMEKLTVTVLHAQPTNHPEGSFDIQYTLQRENVHKCIFRYSYGYDSTNLHTYGIVYMQGGMNELTQFCSPKFFAHRIEYARTTIQ